MDEVSLKSRLAQNLGAPCDQVSDKPHAAYRFAQFAERNPNAAESIMRQIEELAKGGHADINRRCGLGLVSYGYIHVPPFEAQAFAARYVLGERLDGLVHVDVTPRR